MAKSNLRNLPLRDVLAQLEHRCRELIEHLQMDLTQSISEIHDLTRPVRRKSAYPAIRTVCNSFEKLRKSHEYARQIAERIEEGMAVIEEKLPQTR